MSRRDTPEVRQTRGTEAPVTGKCGAQLALTDPPRYCTQARIRGATRCKFHGGRSLVGVASPSWKGSIYSDALKGTLKADYEHLLQDPSLLSLKHEIALTRARLRDQLSKASTLIGRDTLRALTRFFEAWDVWSAARTKSAAAIKAATPVLEKSVVALRASWQNERNTADVMRDIRADTLLLERLERSENARVKELYDMISGERAFALKQAETTIFLEGLDLYVSDGETKQRIRRHVATKFAELAGRRDVAALDAAGGPQSPAADPGPAD